MALKLGNIDDKIIQAKSELMKILVLDVRLKARLQQMGVITDVLNDKMEPVSLTRMERVDLLLDDLKRGPVWRFLHFSKVMHEEGKPDVLKALNMDINYIEDQLEMAAAEGNLPSWYKWKNDEPKLQIERPAEYSLMEQVLSFLGGFFVWVVHLMRLTMVMLTSRPQKRHFYQKEESGEKQEIAPEMLPALLQHCEAMERSLMQNRLFDFSEDVRLDLIDLYVSPDVLVKQNERKQTRIEAREFFLRLFQSHAPNSLLLEGEAGSGKSSLLRQYAYNFCKEFLECHHKGPEVPCEGHMWKLVLYIAAGLMDSSAEEAIRSNLNCQDHLKPDLMNTVSKDGDGILVIQDGMDELRNTDSINSIKKYMEDCQKNDMPKILLSSRNGLSQIEKVLFDRILMIEGFSLEKGLKYVEKYFRLRYDLTDHPVLNYISAHKEEVEWILKSPLRALIFSELTACGELTIDDIRILSRVKLLKAFEMHIIKRDEVCRQADKTLCSQFYEKCLDCLIKDERKLKETDIDGRSPHLAFLSKQKHTDRHASTQIDFIFHHEIFFEFFAIEGLIQCLKSNSPNKKAMLLFLCANSKMRNALLLTCGYISEYEPDLFTEVVFIMQACLTLQGENVMKKNIFTKGLLQLAVMIQETFPPDIFTQGLSPEQAATMEDVSQQIQSAFNQNAEQLRESGWFLKVDPLICPNGNRPLSKFIIDCFNQFTPEQQEEINSATLRQLLPCVMQSRYAFPVTCKRWGAVWGKEDEEELAVWCPSDLTSTLTQYYACRQHPTGLHDMFIHLLDHDCLWGELPAKGLTHEKWVPALGQVLANKKVERLTISTDCVEPTTPLNGLLTALQDVISSKHSLKVGVGVWFGKVHEEVLLTFCEWTRRVTLTVEMADITVVLSEDQDEHYVTRLHQSVQDVMNSEFYPTYVTPAGQTIEYTSEPSSMEDQRVLQY